MVRKDKELAAYLSLINVSTSCIDVGIVDEKFSTGDISLRSNCRTRISILYNVDFFTVLTNKTKAEYLRKMRKKFYNSERQNKNVVFFFLTELTAPTLKLSQAGSIALFTVANWYLHKETKSFFF